MLCTDGLENVVQLIDCDNMKVQIDCRGWNWPCFRLEQLLRQNNSKSKKGHKVYTLYYIAI